MLMAIMPMMATQAQKSAGKYVVKGTVTDSLNNEAEQYATLRITADNHPDSLAILAVTDNRGAFSINLAKAGSYTLSINAVGRKPLTRRFTVSSSTPTANLGTLHVSDISETIRGVEVVAQKPLVKADIDKIEYSVEDDPDSKTNNILEMLRKVPLVTVDGDETIKVNGSEKFKVYVNGRPNNMISNNPKTVLKSMPANSIKKIEVITNPGPKYDAEGIGGILNIITVGTGIEGYSATISSGVANREIEPSLFATVKKGKFTVSARYGYDYYDSPSTIFTQQRSYTGDDNSGLTTDTYNENRDKYYTHIHSGDIEASYEIDTLRLISASVGCFWGRQPNNGTNHFVASSPADGTQLYAYTMPQWGSTRQQNLSASFDYQRRFHTKDRMLTFSYRLELSPFDITKDYSYTSIDANDAWSSCTSTLADQHATSSSHSNEHTFQIDYTTPFARMHTLEAGAKFIMRRSLSNDDSYTRAPLRDGDYEFDSQRSSHYSINYDILAAYLGYGIKWNKLTGRLGLRYEGTWQGMVYRLGRGGDFKTQYSDFVPSASIGYKINDSQNMRLGYNMRIFRPGISFLNPFIDDSEPTRISQGNPDLKSEKQNSLTVAYNLFTTKFTIELNLGYSFINNSIEQYDSYVDDRTINGLSHPTGKYVMYETYRNIGKYRCVGQNVYILWNITSTTQFHSNAYGAYRNYNDGTQTQNHGWYGSFNAGLQQTLPHDWKILCNYNIWSDRIGAQSTNKGNTSYHFNIQKSLFNKRLTLNAWGNMLFTRRWHNRTTIKLSNSSYESDYSYCPSKFGLNVSLRLGDLKTSVKKAERTIKNDDSK